MGAFEVPQMTLPPQWPRSRPSHHVPGLMHGSGQTTGQLSSLEIRARCRRRAPPPRRVRRHAARSSAADRHHALAHQRARARARRKRRRHGGRWTASAGDPGASRRTRGATRRSPTRDGRRVRGTRGRGDALPHQYSQLSRPPLSAGRVAPLAALPAADSKRRRAAGDGLRRGQRGAAAARGDAAAPRLRATSRPRRSTRASAARARRSATARRPLCGTLAPTRRNCRAARRRRRHRPQRVHALGAAAGPAATAFATCTRPRRAARCCCAITAAATSSSSNSRAQTARAAGLPCDGADGERARDGTTVVFFSEAQLRELATAAGEVESLAEDRLVVNRATQTKMRRVWVAGVFRAGRRRRRRRRATGRRWRSSCDCRDFGREGAALVSSKFSASLLPSGCQPLPQSCGSLSTGRPRAVGAARGRRAGGRASAATTWAFQR